MNELRNFISENDIPITESKFIEMEKLINKMIEKDKVGLLEAAKAYQELGVCYRLGKSPSEKLFKRLEKANKLLEKV